MDIGDDLNPSEEYIVFEMDFSGREPELEGFSQKFNEIQWVSKKVRRLGPKGAAYSGGAPAELITLVLSLAANLLSIAKIISERISNGNDTLIRIEDKEIRLKGKWTKEEIAEIINAVAKTVDKKEAFEKISKIKSEKVKEARKELSEIKDYISQYEKLVKIFDKLPEKGKEQKKKRNEYKKKLTGLKAQEARLISLIDFLKQKK